LQGPVRRFRFDLSWDREAAEPADHFANDSDLVNNKDKDERRTAKQIEQSWLLLKMDGEEFVSLT
jgi:hypothetical protein